MTLWWVFIPVVLGTRMKRTQRYVVLAPDAESAVKDAEAECYGERAGEVRVEPYEGNVVDAGLATR